MIEVVASHSAWLDLANTPAQWQMTEAQVRKIVAGLSTAAPSLHWTTAELATFFADVPRQRVGQSIDAALVMGTLQWSLGPGAPTRLSPCMVGAVRLTPSPTGGWIGTLLGAVAPNRALRRAVLAAAQLQRTSEAIAVATDGLASSVTTLGDLFAGDPDGKTEVAGRFLPTVLLCQLGSAVDALLAELLTSPGPARALTRTQQFTLRGTAPDLLFPLDADLAQRDVVAAIVRSESLCVDAMVGAGTTQTVANALINVAAAGKTALLVSDDVQRVAAVQARLESVGLGQCAMAISAETTGLDVATRLVTLLRSSWRPANAAQGDDQLLQRVEEYLQRHWDALLQPLPHGSSLFDALCVASENGAPVVDIAGDLEGLTSAEMTRRRGAVARYVSAATAIADVGPVARHPWGQSQLRTWDRSDAAALADCASALQRLSTATTTLQDVLLVVDTLVPGFDLGSISALGRVAQLCEVAADAPGLGAEALVAARTLDIETPRSAAARAQQSFATPTTVAEYLELALLHRELQNLAAAAFLPTIDTLDLQTTLDTLHRAADGAAAMRYLRMRTPRAQLTSFARSELPADDGELIRSVEVAHAARRAGQALGKAASNAARWFGTLFVDGALDVVATVAALQWAGGLRKTFDACGIVEGNRERLWRALVAQVAQGSAAGPAPLAAVAALRTHLVSWTEAAVDVRRLFAFDGDALSTERLVAAELSAQLASWQAALTMLPDWVDYRSAREAAHAAGLGALVFQFESQSLTADELLPTWERSLNEAALRGAFATSSALRDFEGATLERAIVDFARLDQSALAVAKARAMGRLAELRPALKPQLSNRDVDGIDAEIADLLALVTDRNLAGLSVAAVLTRFAGLWPLLMPCLIMSPAMVASAVATTTVFDTALILDAHRLPQAYAYPALARANAVVAFGTEPLAVDGSLWGTMHTTGATAVATVSLALRYHTLHASLLPVDARNGTVPAARPGNAVRWLANQTRSPAAEVAEVADYIAGVQAQEPSWNFAVLVPSAAHRRDLLQLSEPLTARLVVLDIREPYLPAVDVLLVCSGSWGADCEYTSTYTAEQWRYLLGSAARAQLVVVGADELTGATPTSWQQVALDLRNQAQDVERVAVGNGGHVLAQQLALQLEARGWTVQLGVGDGDARIDLAVVDPNDASSFVLAVEFDSGYNQQNSVRSRARVWPQLLVQRGWRHVRVWALDWLRDSNREAARVHGAVIAAIAAKRTTRRRPSVSPQPASREIAVHVVAASAASAAIAVAVPLVAHSGAADTTPTSTTRTRTAGTELAVGSAPLRIPSEITVRTQSAIRIAIAPYAVAYVPAGRRSPNDLFSAKHVAELHKLIEQVLAAEAPMHISLLTRRVAAYFGVAKPTSEIAARIAEVGSDVFAACWEPNVVWRRDQKSHDLPSVRVAASNPQTKRDVAQVPLMEIAAAIRVVVERAPGLTSADLVRESAKLLGFARFTADVKARIERGLEVATFANAVAVNAGRVALP